MEKNLKFSGYLNLASCDNIGTSINASKFNIKTRITGIDYLCVESCTMLNMQYDIQVGAQIKITFNLTQFTYTFTGSTAGIYAGATLAAFLQSTIRALTSSTTLTVIFNTVNNRITVDTGNASTILFRYSNLFKQLGVVLDSDTLNADYPLTETTNLTFPYPISLPKTQYFDFTSRALTQYQGPHYSSSLKTSNQLLRLKNNMSFGNIIEYENKNKKFIPFDNRHTLDMIDIDIFNDDASAPVLNNSTYNITLSLYAIN